MSLFDIQDDIIKKAIWNASINIVTIPYNVKKIREGSETDYAFIEFKDKTFSLAFAENSLISTIGKYSFFKCKLLQSINFTNAINLKTINGWAFFSCTSLKSIIFPQSLETFGFYGAFYGCSSLSNVKFPKDSNLTMISSGTFGGCPLKTFTFPRKCQTEHSLGEAFSLTKIEEFYVDEDNEYISIYEGSVYSKNFSILYVYKKSNEECKIHPNTTKLEYMTFSGSKCPHIIIPSTVTDFGSHIFCDFKGTKITMLSTPKTLSDSYFRNCPNLREIVLCEGLISITFSGTETIYTNGKLQSLYIPYSLENFDYRSIHRSDWHTCFYGNTQFIKDAIKTVTTYNVHNCYIGIRITPHCGRNKFISKLSYNFIFISIISI